MCYVLFHQLKLNDDLGTYYGIQDLVGVEWQGDSAPQVAKFRDRWQKVLENINPGVTFQEEMLRDILFKKMDVSQAPFFRNDLAHYRREKKDHTYDFLMDSMERYLNDYTLEQNRAIQAAEYGKSSRSMVTKKTGKGTVKEEKVAVPVASKGKGKSSLPQRGDTKLPCWFFHQGTCSKGEQCKFSHAKLSKEEIAKLVKPGSRSQSPTKKGGKTQGKKGRSRSPSPKASKAESSGSTQGSKKMVCMDFMAMKKCTRGGTCPHEHLTIRICPGF